jgi:hypothetical protein
VEYAGYDLEKGSSKKTARIIPDLSDRNTFETYKLWGVFQRKECLGFRFSSVG